MHADGNKNGQIFKVLYNGGIDTNWGIQIYKHISLDFELKYSVSNSVRGILLDKPTRTSLKWVLNKWEEKREDEEQKRHLHLGKS